MAKAQRKARACFALARSTTHEGERNAAVDRGLAICRKAGLDPDQFDIPGRPRLRVRVHIDTDGFAHLPVFNMEELVREAAREVMKRRHRSLSGLCIYCGEEKHSGFCPRR